MTRSEESISPPLPKVEIQNCPIAASLGVLGKKWTFLIIRDIGWQRADRFRSLLRTIPGLTPRVLSMRLRELEDEGILTKIEEENSTRVIRWKLTEKGQYVMPVLMRLTAYGSRYFPAEVFGDRKSRTLEDVYSTNVSKHPWVTGKIPE
jgi:DNA-binding HxlR family transcriptional regulator